MTDGDESDTVEDTTTEGVEDLSVAQASSTYKVRGEFSDDTGTGVLGKNTASNGTPIGVEGAVPNASSGYGLSTPHDANVRGTAELGGISGGVTGSTEITDLLGESLTVDGSNTLQVTSTYKTNAFEAGGSDWNPVSGLSSGTPVELTYDTNGVTTGRLLIETDGVEQIGTDRQEADTRIFGVSSVTIKSREDFGYEKSIDPSSQDSSPLGIGFKDDGTKLFLSGNNTDSIYEYDLPSAWDFSGATYTNNSLHVSSKDPTPRGLALKSDGTKLYVVGEASGELYAYSLSTPWDLSTASFLRSFNPLPDLLSDVEFKPDGTKVFFTSSSSNVITSYDLSVDWDIGTTTNENSVVLDQVFQITGLSFTEDGTQLFTCNNSAGQIYVYNLSSPWDLSTGTYIRDSTLSDTNDTQGLVVKGDRTRAFVTGDDDGLVDQYVETFEGTAYATVERER